MNITTSRDVTQTKKKTIGKNVKCLVIFGTALPVLYLLSLPLLEKVGYAFNMRKGFNMNGTLYHTVSGFITSPQASGAWSAVWFFPFMIMWQSPTLSTGNDRYKGCAFCSLFTM